MPTHATTPDGFTIFAQPIRGRACGSCTLCCTLVPADLAQRGYPEAMKRAGEKCRHVGHHGCKIHARRPDPCRYWSCRWLFDPGTADLRRPDHAGYCVDAIPDSIAVNGQEIEILQVWCDPKRRDAHRDPALRAYIAAMNMAAIVRFGEDDAIVIAPPSMTEGGEWLEFPATIVTAEKHRQNLAAVGAVPFLEKLKAAGADVS